MAIYLSTLCGGCTKLASKPAIVPSLIKWIDKQIMKHNAYDKAIYWVLLASTFVIHYNNDCSFYFFQSLFLAGLLFSKKKLIKSLRGWLSDNIFPVLLCSNHLPNSSPSLTQKIFTQIRFATAEAVKELTKSYWFSQHSNSTMQMFIFYSFIFKQPHP